MKYTRQTPSTRYVEHLGYNKELHLHGDRVNGISPEDTFSGVSLAPHALPIKMSLQKHGARSLLDYGCGKAQGYEKIKVPLPDGSGSQSLKEFWGLEDIILYDPAFPDHDQLPRRQFDCVVSTDVLEHCPEEDLEWIISEIFAFSTSFVFCTVALYSAAKTLPNKENAHVTLKSIGWWADLFETISKKAGGRKYYLVAMRNPKSNAIVIEG
jgi:hypothetical protein